MPPKIAQKANTPFDPKERILDRSSTESKIFGSAYLSPIAFSMLLEEKITEIPRVEFPEPPKTINIPDGATTQEAEKILKEIEENYSKSEFVDEMINGLGSLDDKYYNGTKYFSLSVVEKICNEKNCDNDGVFQSFLWSTLIIIMLNLRLKEIKYDILVREKEKLDRDNLKLMKLLKDKNKDIGFDKIDASEKKMMSDCYKQMKELTNEAKILAGISSAHFLREVKTLLASKECENYVFHSMVVFHASDMLKSKFSEVDKAEVDDFDEKLREYGAFAYSNCTVGKNCKCGGPQASGHEMEIKSKKYNYYLNILISMRERSIHQLLHPYRPVGMSYYTFFEKITEKSLVDAMNGKFEFDLAGLMEYYLCKNANVSAECDGCGKFTVKPETVVCRHCRSAFYCRKNRVITDEILGAFTKSGESVYEMKTDKYKTMFELSDCAKKDWEKHKRECFMIRKVWEYALEKDVEIKSKVPNCGVQ